MSEADDKAVTEARSHGTAMLIESISKRGVVCAWRDANNKLHRRLLSESELEHWKP